MARRGWMRAHGIPAGHGWDGSAHGIPAVRAELAGPRLPRPGGRGGSGGVFSGGVGAVRGSPSTQRLPGSGPGSLPSPADRNGGDRGRLQPGRAAPRRPRLRRLREEPRDEQSRRIKEACVCVCVRGRCAAAPARSPPPRLSPVCAAIAPLSPPALNLGGCRGTETWHPRCSSCPGSVRGHLSGSEQRLMPRGVGVSPGGGMSPRGAAAAAGPRSERRVPLGCDRGCGDSDRSATRCIVSSGVPRSLSYAFACGRWWRDFFLFLCSGRRDPPLFPAGNL